MSSQLQRNTSSERFQGYPELSQHLLPGLALTLSSKSVNPTPQARKAGMLKVYNLCASHTERVIPQKSGQSRGWTRSRSEQIFPLTLAPTGKRPGINPTQKETPAAPLMWAHSPLLVDRSSLNGSPCVGSLLTRKGANISSRQATGEQASTATG